ncbi:kinase-like domain-containing protein [Dichotomocladium elegans]|nr:kinase-like domain-containing protein [Dichotomocladium elegans]
MSVFHQIKNLIRSGRNRSTSTSDGSGELSIQEAKKYEAVARRVQEQNLAKQRLPSYPGLERYKLIDKLGDGAFSNVYKAIDLETNTKVAVKAVRKYELKPQQRASVLKEVQIMRTINHPSIVRLESYIETEDHCFLVLELCEGGELFHQIVRFTYFSEDLSRHCIKQVAEGIRYLHEEKGVVHRDIKPENLLFEPIPLMPRTETLPPSFPHDEDKEDEGEFVPGVGGGGIGRVKIADFGLSKVVWDQHTMTPCGTVGYTAPEIVKDERYSKSVDMWALGCVLYTMLCGFPPFYDESIQVLTEKVAKGQYTFLSPWWDIVSEEAKDLISHLLCIDPNKRYTIDQFLKHPWMNQKSLGEETNVIDTEGQMRTPASDTTTPTSAIIRPMVDMLDIPDGKTSTKERRRDIFSGLSSMKEIFDVSYAVHRMAEERSRRKQLRRKQQQQQSQIIYTQSHQQQPPLWGFSNALSHGLNNDHGDDDDDNDDNDDDDDYDDGYDNDDVYERNTSVPVEQHTSSANTRSMLQRLQRDRLSQQKQQQQQQEQQQHPKKVCKPKPAFELNMDNATLLGRRRIHKENGK